MCNPGSAIRAFQSLAVLRMSSGVAGSYMTRAAKSEASVFGPASSDMHLTNGRFQLVTLQGGDFLKHS